MQASSSPAPSALAEAPESATELAEQLLALWRAVMAPRGVSAYAIFEELDLTLTQVKALSAVAPDTELTIKELAEKLGLSLPGASRAADALVERGLLGRRECPTDRRMKRLTSTEAGRHALQRLDEARLAGLAQFTATLPPAQRKRLSAALAPVLGNLQEVTT